VNIIRLRLVLRRLQVKIGCGRSRRSGRGRTLDRCEGRTGDGRDAMNPGVLGLVIVGQLCRGGSRRPQTRGGQGGPTDPGKASSFGAGAWTDLLQVRLIHTRHGRVDQHAARSRPVDSVPPDDGGRKKQRYRVATAAGRPGWRDAAGDAAGCPEVQRRPHPCRVHRIRARRVGERPNGR
jgi:hypothetical protein